MPKKKVNPQKMPQIEVAGLARRAITTKAQVEGVFLALTALLEEDKIVKIAGFGTFTPIVSEPPKGKHLFGTRKNSRSDIASQRVIRFRMSPDLRAEWKVKRKKNASGD